MSHLVDRHDTTKEVHILETVVLRDVKSLPQNIIASISIKNYINA